MRAYFVVTYNAGGLPVLPPLVDADGGTQLTYTDNGERVGGYAVVSGRLEPTSIALVHASDAVIAAMADNVTDWLYVQTVEEGASGVSQGVRSTRAGGGQAAAKPAKATKAKVKSFLKGKGHKATAVDGLALDSDAQIMASVLALHGLDAGRLAGCGVA